MEWILNLPSKVWLAFGGLILLGGFLVWWQTTETKDDKNNQKIGRQLERADSLGKTVIAVEKSNEVRGKIEAEVRDGNGDRLYDLCLLHHRGDLADCARYMVPERQSD